MQEEMFKPLENEEIKIKPAIINLPEQKIETEQTQIEEKRQNIIAELPTWSIEPPIEIKRGN